MAGNFSGVSAAPPRKSQNLLALPETAIPARL
jgi:hypothetical protein